MNKLRIAMCLILIAISAGGYYASSYYCEKAEHDQQPEIIMDSKSVEISVDDPVEAIFQGVTAVDPEDGDVTDSIVLESLSNFSKKKKRKAVLAAFDSAGNVVKITRTVKYTDYKSPKFEMSGPLSVSASNVSSVLSRVTVTDVIDGELTDQVQLVTDEVVSTTQSGEYEAHLMVSNSAGDTVDLPVTLTAYTATDQSQIAEITLTKSLVYVKKGKKFNASSYVDQVSEGRRTYRWDKDAGTLKPVLEEGEEISEREELLKSSDLKIEDDVDTSKPGVYEVAYYIKKYMKMANARVRLIVIVTE